MNCRNLNATDVRFFQRAQTLYEPNYIAGLCYLFSERQIYQECGRLFFHTYDPESCVSSFCVVEETQVRLGRDVDKQPDAALENSCRGRRLCVAYLQLVVHSARFDNNFYPSVSMILKDALSRPSLPTSSRLVTFWPLLWTNHLSSDQAPSLANAKTCLNDLQHFSASRCPGQVMG